MRIGVTTHNYPPHLGGLETIARALAVGFADRQHEVVVVSTEWNGQEGVNEEDGTIVHRLRAWHGAERRGVPYAVPTGRGLGRAVKDLRRCDVLLAHGSLYATTALAAWIRGARVPLFVTE